MFGEIPMRIIICDDDYNIRKQLNDYILLYFKNRKIPMPDISLFESGEELIDDTLSKDIIFLDIEMSGISGIRVGQILKSENKNSLIFIVTSFSEYLDDAMKFHVFRYLSKPIDQDRLYRNLRDALQIYNTISATICVETKTENCMVDISDIIMVETANQKSILHTATKSYPTIHPLKHWINVLHFPSFIQTHKSFLINMKYVIKFDHSKIILHNHQFAAYLTKRNYSQFKQQYLSFMESLR